MKSNPQPTPGPWSAAGHCPKDLPHRLIADCGDNQAVVTQQSGNIVLREHAQANARLIAAAPDLLAACKVALSAIWQHFEYHHDGDDESDNDACQKAVDQLRSAIALAQEGK